jgi:2-methylisocitrate lyase-like PEP mutase family enzyme
MTEVARKAGELRRLHAGSAILVLVDVWDVASAGTVAALPGCGAIATGSWPIAASLGSRMARSSPATRCSPSPRRAGIASTVDLPVTADLGVRCQRQA